MASGREENSVEDEKVIHDAVSAYLEARKIIKRRWRQSECSLKSLRSTHLT